MRILLVCLLFCVQSAWGAERYFAPNNVAVFAVFENPETGFNGDRYQIEGLSDIEFTLEGQQLSLPQTTFLVDGIDHPYFQCRNLFGPNIERDCDDDDGTFEVNGGTLNISAEIIMEPVTVMLAPDEKAPWWFRSQNISPTTVQVSGTYDNNGLQYQFGSTFDVADRFSRSEVELSLMHWDDASDIFPWLVNDEFGQFAALTMDVQMRTASGDGIFDIGDGTLLRLERFRASTSNFYGIERVPTPDERASFLPGDADLDGAITLIDFLALRQNIVVNSGRGTWGHGDFNGDFNVDFADFLILADNFGNVRTQAAAVPEPGLAVLLLPAILLLRRRK